MTIPERARDVLQPQQADAPVFLGLVPLDRLLGHADPIAELAL